MLGYRARSFACQGMPEKSVSDDVWPSVLDCEVYKNHAMTGEQSRDNLV